MNPRTRLSSLVIPLMLVALAAAPAVAQGYTQDPNDDRLFLGFAVDAALVEQQWWEGDLQYSDADFIQTMLLRGVGAVRVMDRLEVGGTIGFGNTDTSNSLPEGTGATDFDVYGKWYLGSGERTTWAAGANLTIPSGDNTSGLGTDQWSLGGFGSMRYQFSRVTFAGSLGFRLNSDAQFLGSPELDGKTSFNVLAAAVFPLSDPLSLIGELTYESEKFEGGEEDSRFLVGLNWRVSPRGMVRPAVEFGLTDGAPDYAIRIGYAFHF